MKHEESRGESHILKKIFWGTIAVAAFMKAIEGPNHELKRKKHSSKKNKIIYIYK